MKLLSCGDDRWKYVVYYCILTILYAVPTIFLPFNHGPDEAMRFQVINELVANKFIPSAFSSGALFDHLYGFGYSILLSNLNYILSYISINTLKFMDVHDIYLIARLTNMSLGLLSIYVFQLLLKELLENVKISSIQLLTLVSCYALWPEVFFVATYVNMDTSALLLTNLFTLFYIKGYKSKWSHNELIYIGVFAGFTIISYYNEYSILCSVVIAILFDAVIRSKIGFKKIIFNLALSSFLILIIAGPYVINNIHYYNDISGLTTATETLRNVFGLTSYRTYMFGNPRELGYSLFFPFTYPGFIRGTAMSFFAAFGYMRIYFPLWLYQCYFIIFGITSIIGILMIIKKYIKHYSLIVFAILSIVINFILYIYYQQLDIQPQGRYLFSSFIFLMAPFIYSVYLLRKNRQINYLILFILFLLVLFSLKMQFDFYFIKFQIVLFLKIIMSILLFYIILYLLIKHQLIRFFSVVILSSYTIAFTYFSWFINLYPMHPVSFKLSQNLSNKNIDYFKIIRINDEERVNGIFNLYLSRAKIIPLQIVVDHKVDSDVKLSIGDQLFSYNTDLFKYNNNSDRQQTILSYVIPIQDTESLTFCLHFNYSESNTMQSSCAKIRLRNETRKFHKKR